MVVVIGWPRCGGGGDCGAGVWCSVVVVWYSSGSVVYVLSAMSVGTKGDEQLTLCTNRNNNDEQRHHRRSSCACHVAAGDVAP